MQNLFAWETMNFIFVIIFGTILHFVYEWTGNNRFVGVFSPINESVWEHLKMLFIPIILFSIVEYFAIGKDYINFVSAKSFGILLGMFFIVVFFYTYTGIIGKNYLWIDILTFILGVVIAFVYSGRNINNNQYQPVTNSGCLLLLAALAFSFVVFTLRPPHINLFVDPVSKKSGR